MRAEKSMGTCRGTVKSTGICKCDIYCHELLYLVGTKDCRENAAEKRSGVEPLACKIEYDEITHANRSVTLPKGANLAPPSRNMLNILQPEGSELDS